MPVVARFPSLRLQAAIAVLALAAAAPANAGEPTPTSDAKPVARGVQDPMDMLREKLAQKLGARNATADNPNVMRVVSKASAMPAVDEHAAPAPALRAVRRKPAPAAEAAEPAHPQHWDYSGNGGAGPRGRAAN